MSEEPTTAAVQRHLNALAGDAPAEPIVREPPNSASPRHPLTRCTSPPCDRCRDDPTLVCVTRKPSGEAARPHGNCWAPSRRRPISPGDSTGLPGAKRSPSLTLLVKDRHPGMSIQSGGGRIRTRLVSRPAPQDGVGMRTPIAPLRIGSLFRRWLAVLAAWAGPYGLATRTADCSPAGSFSPGGHA